MIIGFVKKNPLKWLKYKRKVSCNLCFDITVIKVVTDFQAGLVGINIMKTFLYRIIIPYFTTYKRAKMRFICFFLNKYHNQNNSAINWNKTIFYLSVLIQKKTVKNSKFGHVKNFFPRNGSNPPTLIFQPFQTAFKNINMLSLYNFCMLFCPVFVFFFVSLYSIFFSFSV